MGLFHFFIKLKEWCLRRDDIDIILLVGSYARGEATLGSDIDLVIITNNPNSYTEDLSFGSFYKEIKETRVEDYGKLKSVRINYDDGLEVEFGFTCSEWIQLPVDMGTKRCLEDGYKVILDRNSEFNEFLKAL